MALKIIHVESKRHFHYTQDLTRDTRLFSILSSNSSSVYRAIKSSRTAFTGQIPYLTVDERSYLSNVVHDGFMKTNWGLTMTISDELGLSSTMIEFWCIELDSK